MKDGALRGDALLSLAGVVGDEAVEEVLKAIHARDGQRDLPVGMGQQADFECPSQQQGDQNQQKTNAARRILP